MLRLMRVLLIAALHAIPIVLIGLVVQKKWSVDITALIMCFVAIATGSPRYILVDLVAVGIAWILMRNDLSESN